MIEIPAPVLAAVYAHATTSYPAECCGYLVGTAAAGAVDAAIACTNAQAGDPIATGRGVDTGYAITGPELFAFARSFDGPRPAREVYHSHPSGRAYFSELDQRLAAGPAYPVQHLVIGVTAAGVTEAAQFAWSAATGAFVELARWRP